MNIEQILFYIFHNPYAISIRELRDRIISRLNIRYQGPPLPNKVAIPSEEWIRLNFAPSNAYTTKAMQYTGRFNVKYKVQSRLLRKSSEDEHYCRTLFKYEREFNIKYRDYACFISADDKHKVLIGEVYQYLQVFVIKKHWHQLKEKLQLLIMTLPSYH